VLLTECDRRNLLLTLIDRCVDNTGGMTQKSNRKRASFLLQWRYSCLLCIYAYTMLNIQKISLLLN